MSPELDNLVELQRKRARKKRRLAQLYFQLHEWRLAAALSEEELADPPSLLQNATLLAEHVPLPQEICDFLYQRSRYTLSREEWDRKAGFCIAIKTIVDAHFTRLNDFIALLTPAGVSDLVKRVSPRSTLFLLNHGGTAPLARAAFSKIFADGITIAWRQQGNQAHSAMRDPAAALFAARRALLEGHPLLMAPDGVLVEGRNRLAGNQKTRMSDSLVRNQKIRLLNVLGLEWPVSDGAAFLAYDTRCETVWFTISVSEGGLTPVVMDGPRRKDGEPFQEFQERFWHFYANEIERALTGDPCNLPLGRVPSLLARASVHTRVS